MPIEPQVDSVERLRRSGRETSELSIRLSRWLSTHFPDRTTPRVDVHAGVDSNGMSSETVLFTASWPGDADVAPVNLVARVQPRPQDVPVFPTYRLDHQFAVMERVATLTALPIPRVHWYEDDPAVLGSPFFVMDRVDGRIPPDVMPYPMGGNWLYDAPVEDQRRLQDESVDLLIDLHQIAEPVREFGYLVGSHVSPLRQHMGWIRSCYDFSVEAMGRSRLVDDCFEWLEEHWSTSQSRSPEVLLWGDARIGNVIYSGFTPAAVLDWEMAAIGPRELDVSWMVFSHRLFEEIAHLAGLPGMPEFMLEDDVRRRYEDGTGVVLADLTWFHVYSGLMWCVFLMRTGARRVHFGEAPMPNDVEELFFHAAVLRRMMAGVEPQS